MNLLFTKLCVMGKIFKKPQKISNFCTNSVFFFITKLLTIMGKDCQNT